MEHDGSLTFAQLHGSEERLLSALISIQERHTSSRTSDWAHNLRFIQIPSPPLEQCAACHLSSADVTLLRLTEPRDYTSVMNYVCVSYSWKTSPGPRYGTEGKYHIIGSDGCRSNRAPTRVLRRAVAYAVRHEIPFIWVDHECIDQNDARDRELGIHSMDLVYRRSNQPLGLLDVVIDSQAELDFFTELLACPSKDRNELVLHVRNVLHSGDTNAKLTFFAKFITDSIWSRAWIFQEQGLTKEKMAMLVEIAPGLYKHDLPNVCDTDVEVPLKNVLSWPAGCAIAFQEIPKERHPTAAGVIEILQKLILVERYEPDLEIWNKMERQTISNCWSQLDKRLISVTSDRLAIFANFQKHHIRLNTAEVEAAGHGLSTCVLALALLNGNITPFADAQAASHGGSRKRKGRSRSFWLPSTNSILSMRIEEALIYWTFPDDLLRQSFGRVPRLPNVRLHSKGLETSGWLWVIDKHVLLPGIRQRHDALRLLSDTSIPSHKLKALLYLFFLDLIAEMKKRKLRKVVDSIQYTLGYHQRGRQQTLDLQWTRNESTGEPICLPRNDVEDQSLGMATGAYAFTLLDQPPASIRWLLPLVQEILNNEAVWCARLYGHSEMMALFDCAGLTSVFTTSDVDMDALRDAAAPIGLLNVISVEVARVHNAKGTPSYQQLMYTGRWRNGVWYAPKELLRRYEFPWDILG